MEVESQRIEAMLQTALGKEVGSLLLRPDVIELMLNHNGCVWVDSLDTGRYDSGYTLSKENAERAIYIIATSIGTFCTKESPILSAELPGSGYRFQGLLPPIVLAPSFSIRKKALKIFSLSDYVAEGILSSEQEKVIKRAVKEKKNILIVGGTGSGKTTLANAILKEIALTNDRIIIIEDTKELQCEADDFLSLKTKEGSVTMQDLLKATLRLRPDRIIIGEVRGKEALDLLKAWNTGHPGGIATIHADSASKGLLRMKELIEESGVRVSMDRVRDAIGLIIYIEKTERGRVVKELMIRKGKGRGSWYEL